MTTSSRYSLIKPDEKKVATTTSRYSLISPISDTPTPTPEPITTPTPEPIPTPEPTPLFKKEDNLLTKAGKYILQTNPFIPGNLFDQAKKQVTQAGVEKTLNTEIGKKIIGGVSEKTEDIPLKIASNIQALKPEVTYEGAYKKWSEAKANPENPVWKDFLYNLQGTGAQSLIGVAMSFIPYAGKPLAATYWGALSANEQLEERGKVESFGNIGIDVAGDMILGNSLEGLFKPGVASLKKTLLKSGIIEGSTEALQSLLKYGNDYTNAKTPEERQVVLSEAKNYITSGGILMEAAVGATVGAGIGGGVYAAKQSKELYEGMTPEERQAGFVKIPTGDSPKETAQGILDLGTKNLQSDIAETIEPLEKVLMADERTPIKERVGFLDYFRTPWKVYEKMGIRKPYQKVMETYENYVLELPKNIDKVTAWSNRVSQEANEKIFRFLDGESVILTPEETKVAGEIKAWLAEWADKLGLDQDARISEYITHIFPFGKGGEIPEEIALLINRKIPGSVFNPFLLQRRGEEGYLKDTWKALDAYTKRATRKVHMDPALEELKKSTDKMTDTSQLNYINRNVGAINLRPTELDTSIDNHIKNTFGYILGGRPTAAITRSVRKTIYRAKIAGSVVSFAKNLTQGVNTFAELGPQYTTYGYIDLVKFGKKELEENGVLISPFVEDRTYSAVKKAAEKFDNALFVNMSASELVNRGAAYYGAKAKFLDGKITPKEVKIGLNKTVVEGYEPTLKDATEYGKYIAARTQFRFSPVDTPVGLSSDIAKTAAQLQTFGLKQAEFILSMKANKEYVKLVRYMLSSMLLFAYIGSAFGMKWDDSFKTLRWGYPPIIQFIIDLAQKGVFGKDKYGNKLDPMERVKGVGGSLFTNIVPAGAQLKRSYEGLKAVSEGASRSKGGAFQYRIDQTPMNYIRGTLFGKGNLPQAQDYYDKKDKKSSNKNKGRYSVI